MESPTHRIHPFNAMKPPPSRPNLSQRGLVICTALLLHGCSHFQASNVARVGAMEVEYVASSGKGPPIVFENGLGGSFDGWKEVYPSVSVDHAAVLYHRFGYGKSSDTTAPRDGQHIVEELRTFLKAKDIQPPYVLVGHSVGGLYAQYFARKHPEEVSALVLVDSTHPHQMQGNGAPEHWSSWVRFAVNVITPQAGINELQYINATGDAVLELPMPMHIPVWILAAKKEQDRVSTDAYIRDTQDKRQDLLRLYPQAKVVWVDSGHVIPLEKPEAVIEAIQQAIAAHQP